MKITKLVMVLGLVSVMQTATNARSVYCPMVYLPQCEFSHMVCPRLPECDLYKDELPRKIPDVWMNKRADLNLGREVNRPDYTRELDNAKSLSESNEEDQAIAETQELVEELTNKGLSVSVSHNRDHGDGSRTEVRATYTDKNNNFEEVQKINEDAINKGWEVSVNHSRDDGRGGRTDINISVNDKRMEDREKEETKIEIRYTWEF